MAQHGGKRPGAGRTPGSRNRATKQAKATIGELAQAHAPAALAALVEVMQSADSASARVAAANSILDRAYGKPIQTVATPDDEAPSLTINIGVREAKGDVRITEPERPAGDIPDGADD